MQPTSWTPSSKKDRMSDDDLGKEPYIFEGGIEEVLRDSGKALLLKTVSGTEFWVPHSVIHEDSEVFEMGGSGSLVVHQWWAEKKWGDE